MTDLQTIVVMFGRAGIEYTIAPTRDSNTPPLPAGMTVTVARADEDTPRIFGYLGFFAEFYFDADGVLLGVGAWE